MCEVILAISTTQAKVGKLATYPSVSQHFALSEKC